MIRISSQNNSGILYSNCLIKNISADEAGGSLTINALFDKKEARELVYEDMYYSQLDQRNIGQNIVLAKEISLNELLNSRYKANAEQMFDDCGANSSFIQNLIDRGSRLFFHYLENDNCCLVIAKQLLIKNTFTDKKKRYFGSSALLLMIVTASLLLCG